jgi:hypothetical protein
MCDGEVVLTLSFALCIFSAVPGPQVSVQVSNLQQLKQLGPFLEVASRYSNILQPQTLVGEAYPLLPVDIFSADSLNTSGLNAQGPWNYYKFDALSLACLQVVNPTVFIAATNEKLKRSGELFNKKINGLNVIGVKDSLGRTLSAYIIDKQRTCALTGHGYSIEKQLPLLAQYFVKPYALQKPPQPGLAELQLQNGEANFSCSAKGRVAQVDARFTQLNAPHFQGPGPSVFARFSSPGLLNFRARFEPKEVPALLRALLPRIPFAKTLEPAIEAIAPHLTGNVALFASQVKVTKGLLSTEARFFALKLAVLAETNNSAQAERVLKSLDASQLSSKSGTLKIKTEGNFISLSNDDKTLESALGAARDASGVQKHGFEFTIEAPLLAKALGQVPLLEAVQSAELAGVLAAGTETGPLLTATEKIEGRLDYVKDIHIGHLDWSLSPRFFSPTGDTVLPR